MSEFYGLYKHKNSAGYTQRVSLQSVEVGHYTEEEGKKGCGWRKAVVDRCLEFVIRFGYFSREV